MMTACVLDAANVGVIVRRGADGALQLPINPAMKISTSKIFIAPPSSSNCNKLLYKLSRMAAILPIHDEQGSAVWPTVNLMA
jgi:hypothetical protein